MPRNAWPVGRNMKRFLLNRWVWPIVSAVAALAFLNAPARGLFVAAGLAQETDLQSQLNTTEQVAGFYDPHTKTMNMADWIPPEMQSMVLSHELTHALQDQNYDLDKFLHAARDNDDATSARQAIVEGHAMAAMMQHALGQVD